MKPEEALCFWGARGDERIKLLPTGIFNDTYEVRRKVASRPRRAARRNAARRRGGELLILQKLHRLISGDGPTANYRMVTSFLRRRGIPQQEVIPTSGGKLLGRGGGETWRLMSGIEGKIYAVAPSLAVVREAGRCLGETHKALKDFNGELRATLPMFQYEKVLKKLGAYRGRFAKSRDREVRAASGFLLQNFPKHFLPDGLPKRVIHTDPKISNFVFRRENAADGLRGARAVAIIDWDTVQSLSPLYDIGDALRSFCGGAEDDPRNEFAVSRHRAFLDGYFAASGKYLSERERRLIPRATALVILGLAARFLNDYAEDFYFSWDKKRYGSRKEHNLARALGQIALYRDFASKIQRG